MKLLTRQDIDRLTPSERLALIGDLWDSLDDAHAPLPEAQRAELERRLSGFEEEAPHAISWDELKADLVARTR